MLTLKFIQRKDTRVFEGDKAPRNPVDAQVFDGKTLVFETKQGYRDKFEAARVWSDIRDVIVSGNIVIEGDPVAVEK